MQRPSNDDFDGNSTKSCNDSAFPMATTNQTTTLDGKWHENDAVMGGTMESDENPRIWKRQDEDLKPFANRDDGLSWSYLLEDSRIDGEHDTILTGTQGPDGNLEGKKL